MHTCIYYYTDCVYVQSFQFEQDFEEERAARAEAAGSKDTLARQLRDAMAEVEDERKEKRVLIAKLEEAVTEKQRFAIQKDFNLTMAARAQEVEHLRAELFKFQQQLQRDKDVYERRKNELVQEIDDLRKKVAALEEEAANFKEEAEIEMGEKLSLKELLKTVTEDQKNKEKMLEILANQKFSVEDQLAREKNRLAALAQNLHIKEEELTHAKQNSDRLAVELQYTRERLDTRVYSLIEQVKSFETIASQHKHLQQNSKLQSTVVVNLKRKLEAAEVCIAITAM